MSQPKRLRTVFEKKEIKPNADTKLEKGDKMALLIAAFSVFGPILLMGVGILALFIWAWNAFF